MNFEDEYYVDKHGVICQKNISDYDYNQEYLNSYIKIKDKCDLLSEKRMNFLKKHVKNIQSLLDFGSGTGEFLQSASKDIKNVFSYDIIPKEFEFAKTIGYDNVVNDNFDVVCFFDSLEHLRDPSSVINSIDTTYIYISLPWSHHREKGFEWFMNWKHRKPNEHLFHFDDKSLSNFMNSCGYDTVSIANIEDLVRTRYDKNLPNILTGIFKKQNERT